jgi:hypothetical protein
VRNAKALSLQLLLFLTGFSFAEAPSFTSLFPAGGQRGTKVTVKCEGKFEWPLEVHAPGVQVETGQESGVVEVTIPEQLACDRIWLRLYNAQGASEARPFLIGDVAELQEMEPNNTLREAQVIEGLPVIANGVLKGADVDCFAVTLEAGQTLIAAVDAHSRLGSPIDSVLQITNSQGIVLADNHDDLGLDPRISFAAEHSGTFIVRLFGFSSEPNQSIALQGCDQCIYRLTLTTGPYATHPIPLAVQSSTEAEVTFGGWNLPEGCSANPQPYGGPVSENEFETEPLNDLNFSAESSLGFASHDLLTSGRRLRLVPFPALLSIDGVIDNAALSIVPPTAVTGCLRFDGQVDRYSIDLKAGDTLLASCEARTLGLPTDPWLQLQDPEGKIVADVDDSAGTRDSLIRHAIKTDGLYTIIVMDRFRKGSHRNFYLLTAHLEQADFRLIAQSDRVIATPEKPAELPIQVVRSGAAGPIRLFVDPLPEGVTAEPVESLVEGESAKQVTLRLSSDGAGFSGPIRIVGQMEQPRPLRRIAASTVSSDASFRYVWLTALPLPGDQQSAP